MRIYLSEPQTNTINANTPTHTHTSHTTHEQHQFLNLPGCEFVIRLSLATEYIGVCNTSWLLYHLGAYACCGNVIKAREEMKRISSAGVAASEEAMSPTTKARGENHDTGLPEHEPMALGWFDVLKVNAFHDVYASPPLHPFPS